MTIVSKLKKAAIEHCLNSNVFNRIYRVRRRSQFYKYWIAAGPRKQGNDLVFLVLNHCYDLDLEALCAADTSYTIWSLEFAHFDLIDSYFSDEVRHFRTAYNGPQMAPYIAKVREDFMRPLVDRLIRDINPDVLVTPSDLFYWFRPFIQELRDHGIPTIVQDKEGTISPGPLTDERKQAVKTKYPPISDQYYCWSEGHREFWLEVGVEMERSAVLGQPRSDFFFHSERWPSLADLEIPNCRKLVVIFTFDGDAYATTTELRPDYAPWRPLRGEIHDVVRSVARDNGDCQFILKVHPQQKDIALIEQEANENPVSNVRLMKGAAIGSHLIVNADVVVGFQTTALIEAMLLKKPIIYAGWGAAASDLDECLIPIHRSGGCMVPQNATEFENQLRAALCGEGEPDEAMLAARKRFTQKYFADADGSVSKRVLDTAAAYVRSERERLSQSGVK